MEFRQYPVPFSLRCARHQISSLMLPSDSFAASLTAQHSADGFVYTDTNRNMQ